MTAYCEGEPACGLSRNMGVWSSWPSPNLAQTRRSAGNATLGRSPTWTAQRIARLPQWGACRRMTRQSQPWSPAFAPLKLSTIVELLWLDLSNALSQHHRSRSCCLA